MFLNLIAKQCTLLGLVCDLEEVWPISSLVLYDDERDGCSVAMGTGYCYAVK